MEEMKRRSFLGFILGAPAALVGKGEPEPLKMAHRMEDGREMVKFLVEALGLEPCCYNAHFNIQRHKHPSDDGMKNYYDHSHYDLDSGAQRIVILRKRLGAMGWTVKESMTSENGITKCVAEAVRNGRAEFVGIAEDMPYAMSLLVLNIVRGKSK